MNCIAPDEIQDGDLLAFAEGRASQQVQDHVARCAFCAAEAKALRQVDRSLAAALYRASCPDTETLVQYQSKLLPRRERRQIERHLKECALCADEVRRLAALDAPQHSLWEELRRAVRDVIEAVRLEPPPHLAFTVRSGDASPRLHRAGDLDILLGSEAQRPTRDLWRLRGRATRGGHAVTELTGCAVRLVQESRPVASGSIDDLGYFALDNLAAGRYDLWLEAAETDIVVREIALG